MGKIKILLISIICLFVVFSCDDLIVKDIEGKEILLVSPADSIEVEQINITFLWEDLEGAEKYLLQVATPSFANAASILLDTLLEVNSFSYDFVPGEYEWRLRGENTVSNTAYHYRKMTIRDTITESDAIRQEYVLSEDQ